MAKAVALHLLGGPVFRLLDAEKEHLLKRTQHRQHRNRHDHQLNTGILINTLIICVVRDSIFYDGMRAFMCMHVYVVYMYICIMCVCVHTHPALIYIAIEILNCRLRMRDHIDSCSEPARRDGEYGLTAAWCWLLGVILPWPNLLGIMKS